MTFGADDLLALYAKGQFPMASDRTANSVSIIDPEWRGILPLDGLHIPRRLARTIRQNRFRVHVNRNFAATIQMCAESAPDRPETWINHGIEVLCHHLYLRGAAHSVECYLDDRLVGGLYGVILGGAFFGESMFSRERDASKVALFHLCARLVRQGFFLLDTQFMTDHLAQFGAIEIDRTAYLQRLETAKAIHPVFGENPDPLDGSDVLEILQVTSTP
ncbi:MAG: leucyl/phenylalanyl-tRNA--protein transferase [Robiginitomaculum sp.]|nr:MAG: leucyl/phenylalanyl-tRNA--protein transferase [Robiginitomaculum sp.]